MNNSSRTAPPSRDTLTLLALAAGLVMGHVVAAMAGQPTAPGLALPSALVFVVCGSAAVLCALAAAPRRGWGPTRVSRWVTAIGAGLLGALAPSLIF